MAIQIFLQRQHKNPDFPIHSVGFLTRFLLLAFQSEWSTANTAQTCGVGGIYTDKHPINGILYILRLTLYCGKPCKSLYVRFSVHLCPFMGTQAS